MKSLALFMIILALSLSACRNTSLNPGQEGSSLQGVYDDDYLLRMGRVSGESNLYQFETCFTAVHLSKQGNSLGPEESCVPALLDGSGESITFNIIPASDKLALSEEEQRNLLKMQSKWGAYKARQKDFKTSEVIGATIGGVAGGVVIGNTASMVGLHRKAQSGLLQAEERYQKIWNDQFKVDGSQNPDRYKSILGNADKKQAIESLLSTEKKLNRFGYSALDDTQGMTITAAELKSKGGHIFSDEFITYLKSPKVTEYLKKAGFKKDGITLFTERSFILHNEEIHHVLNSFVDEKASRDFIDIIDSNFLDRFLRHLEIKTQYRFNKKYKKSSLYQLSDDLAHELSRRVPSIEISQIKSFVEYRGIPRHVMDDIRSNKVIFDALKESFPNSLLKNASKTNLVDTLTDFKNSAAYVNTAKKLTQESAEKISRMLRKSLPVIIIGAITTVAILNHSKQQVQAAEEPVKQKELEINQLNVLLDHSSPLMSTDPSKNVEVPSVKDVLTYLAIAWQGVSTTSNVTHYCYPKITGKGTVEADCQDDPTSYPIR